MKHKLILLSSILFFLCSAFKSDKPVITVFMIGDSTMADKNLTGGTPKGAGGRCCPAISPKRFGWTTTP